MKLKRISTYALAFFFCGPAMAATAGSCPKEVVVFLDLSGTMTKETDGRVPLTAVAKSVLALIDAEGVVEDEDEIEVTVFGNGIETLAPSVRYRTARELLEGLSDEATFSQTLGGNLERYRQKTDFKFVFDEMVQRGRNPTKQLHLFVIASDFVHDHIGVDFCDPRSVPARIADFQSKFKEFQRSAQTTFAESGDTGTRSRLALTIVGKPSCKPDLDVHEKVVESLVGKEINAKPYEQTGDAVRIGKDIADDFSSAVHIEPEQFDASAAAGAGTTRFLAITSCGDPTIAQIEFTGDRTTRPVNVQKQDGNKLDVADSDLREFMNSYVTVKPIVERRGFPVKPIRYWLGDQIQFKSATPHLYPRPFVDGRGLLRVELQSHLQREVKITIDIPGAGSHSYLLPKQRAQTEALRFKLSRQATDVLTDGQRHTIEITSKEAGLLTPQKRFAESTITLNTEPVNASKAQLITFPTGLIVCFFGMSALILRIFARTRAGDRTASTLETLTNVSGPLTSTLFGGALMTNMATDVEQRYGTTAWGRSLLVVIVVWIVLRWGVIRYWRFFERPLGPGRSVSRKASTALWVITAVALFLGGLTFYYFYAADLPSGTLIIEELRESS